MSPKNDGFIIRVFWAMLFINFILMILPTSAIAQKPEDRASGEHRSSPISALQGFVSQADGPRCPMLPTCSHYASQALAQHGLLIGWMLTCDRLLRCGRDETRLAPIIRTPDGARVHDPLSANIFWWKEPR